VTVLRQVEVGMGHGKTIPQSCRRSFQAIRDLLGRADDARSVA
jgi:hypothetical protein